MEFYTDPAVRYKPAYDEEPPPPPVPDDPGVVAPPAVETGQADPAPAAPATSKFYVDPAVKYKPMFDKGSYVGQSLKGVAQGAVSSTGSAIKGTAALPYTIRRNQVEDANQAADVLEKMERGEEVTDYERELFSKIPEAGRSQAIADFRQTAKDAEPGDIREDPFYQAGEAVENWSEEQFKASRDFQGGWTRAITEGLGSLATTAGAGLIGGPVAVAAVGAGMSEGEAIDRALAAGAKPEEIMNVMKYGGLPGMTETIPIEVLFAKIPVGKWGKFATVLGKIGAQVFVEGGQEGVQQWMQNLIAKYNYKDDQDLTEGVWENTVIGGLVGGIAAAPVAPFTTPKTVLPAAEEDKQDETTEAETVLPEGVEAPDPASTVADQTTPGDTAAKDPPQPVGKPAVATEEAGKQEIVVATPETVTTPEGQQQVVTPATAAGPTIVNPGQVSPEIAAAADPTKQPKPLTAEQQAAKEAKAKSRLGAIGGLNIGVDPAVAAAAAAGQPEPTPVLNKPAPEPSGTVEAAERRAQPQDAVLPPAEVPVAAPVASEPVVEPDVPPTVDDPAGQERLDFLRALAEADGYNWDDVLQMPVEGEGGSRQLLTDLEEQYKAGDLVIPGMSPEPAAVVAPVDTGQPVIPESPVEVPQVSEREQRRKAILGDGPPDMRDRLNPAEQAKLDKIRGDQQLREQLAAIPDQTPEELAENGVVETSPGRFETVETPIAAEFAEKPQDGVIPEVAVEGQPVERTPPATAPVAPRPEFSERDLYVRQTARGWNIERPSGHRVGEVYATEEAAQQALRKSGYEDWSKRGGTGQQHWRKEPSNTEVSTQRGGGQPAPAPRVAGKLTISRPAPSVADVKSKRGVTIVKEVPKPTAVTIESGDTTRPTNVALLLGDAIRNRLKKDAVTDDPDYEATVDRVARELTAKLKKGAPPKAETKRLLDEATAAVKQRIEQAAADKAVKEAADAEIQHAKAKAAVTARERGSSVTGKEKPAEAVAEEEEDTIRDQIKKELEKPEAERHPKRVRQAELFEERKKWKGGGAEKLTEEQRAEGKTTRKEKREAATAEIKKLQAEIAEEAAERQRAAAPKVVAEKPKSEKEQRQELLAPVIASVPSADLSKATVRSIPAVAKKHMQDLVAAVRAALKGRAMGDNVNVKNLTPVENLAIFAETQLKKTKGEPDHGTYMTGLLLLQAGEIDEFNRLMGSEATEKGEIAGADTDPAPDTSKKDKDALKATVKAGDYYDLPQAPDFDQDEFITSEIKPGPKPVLDENGEIDPTSISRPVDEREEILLLDENGLPVAVRPHSIHRTGDMVSLVTNQSLAFSTLTPGGLADVIRRMHAKVLKAMVGDIPVVFLSAEDMARLRHGEEPAGTYFWRHPTMRAGGMKPYIVVNHDSWQRYNKNRQQHVILHEATHAATVHAVQRNFHGVGVHVDKMMKELKADLIRTGKWDTMPDSVQYGFKSAVEFVAEAFSNPAFQQMLAQHRVSIGIDESRYRIAGRQPTRDSTWQKFLRAVTMALGMRHLLSSGRGSTYIEQIVAVHPALMMSEQDQQADSAWYTARYGPESDRRKLYHAALALPSDTAVDLPNIRASVEQQVEAKRSEYDNLKGRTARFIRQKGATTKEILRRSQAYWGGPDNPLKAYGVAGLKAANRLRKAARKGQDILVRMADARRGHVKAFEELTGIFHRATLGQYNPMESLSHETNKHIKKGDLDAHTRAQHAEDHAKWLKLPRAIRDPAQEFVEHLREKEATRVQRLVRNIIRQAVESFDLKLPAGETEASVQQWVMSGDIDKRVPADPANVQANERTQRDQDLHDALGKTAKTLKGSKEMHLVKGMYVPLMRRGDLGFSATHKVEVVPGSSLLDDGQTLVFHDKKTWQDYVKTAHNHDDRQILNRPWIEHLDPATGEEVGAKDARGRPFYFVKIQNKAMETHDNQVELARLREEYKANGFEVSAIFNIDKEFNADSALMPQQLQRIVRNMQQSSQSASATKANVGAVVDAYIRQMSGNRAAHRRIKRQGIKGYSTDLLRNSYEANFAISRHVENLDVIPEMAKLENDVVEYLAQAQKNNADKDDFDHLERQAQFKEIQSRLTSKYEAATSGFVKNVLDVSFIYRLFTPAYTAANILGGVTTGFAVLGEKSSPQAVMRAMTRSLMKLGAKDLTAEGFKQFAGEIANAAVGGKKAFDFHEDFIQKKLKAGTLERQFADELEAQGFGVSGGLETSSLTELGASNTRKYLDRGMRVARVFPEVAETLNRYVTGLAALQLAKDRGLSDEAAIEYAIDSVERSQGGYAAENNAAYFNHPVLKITLQFKKYAQMYGQLYYGAVMGMLGQSSHQTRMEAARTFGYLTAFNVVMAGVYGVAPMELARMFGIIASQLGGDDWDEVENWMQEMLADVIGKTPAEMLTRGFSRLFNVDLSNRLGNDNLLAFGDPQGTKANDVKAWGFDLLVGAPGAMFADIAEALKEGDFIGALPLPKLFTDAVKAVKSTIKGPTSATGREYAEPLGYGDAAIKALGLRPATEARRFEAGGSSAKHFAEQKMMARRTAVMQEYANASPSDRRDVWDTKIRAWNDAHPEARINYGNLQRSINARKQQEKKRKRELEEAE